MRILVIEDDDIILETLEDLLKDEGYTVVSATTGKTGLEKAKSVSHDLIILDLGLPDMSGQEVCRNLRTNGITTPVIILTGHDSVADKVSGLDSGADDYVLKPFTFPELSARIRAVLRRTPDGSSSILQHGDLTLDSASRKVVRANQIIPLRRKEFNLLEYLMRNQGRVVTRAMILDQVWEDNGNQFSNIVDVHIKYLRDRIERPFPGGPIIKTIHGLGYTIPILPQ